MFELPASKRIRRADLRNGTRSSTSPSPSALSSPDPELENQAHARFAALYGNFSLPDFASGSNGKLEAATGRLAHSYEDERENDEEEEQGFEFRLFSNDTAKSPQRIVLKLENDEDGDGTFVRKERDKSYYFSTPALGDMKAGIESMAVSGETILSWRNTRARGLEVPWRVKTIRAHNSSKQKPQDSITKAAIVVEDRDKNSKKCKPNKKRRLVLREKQRKKDKAEEERRKRNEGKEEAEREKRTRRNREKKVKRKMKEKAKKAGEVGDDGMAKADVNMAGAQD